MPHMFGSVQHSRGSSTVWRVASSCRLLPFAPPRPPHPAPGPHCLRRAHAAPDGLYHYHSEPGRPSCVYTDTPGQHSPMFGAMLDGIPVYGIQVGHSGGGGAGGSQPLASRVRPCK